MVPPSPASGRLFVSYSRKNSADVIPFVERLADAGVDVWIDRQEIAAFDDFPLRIREALAGSGALLAWYSREYAESIYCQKELTAAWMSAQGLPGGAQPRILIVNPEPGVDHVCVGDLARQNYLPAPRDQQAFTASVEAVRARMNALPLVTWFRSLSSQRRCGDRPRRRDHLDLWAASVNCGRFILLSTQSRSRITRTRTLSSKLSG